MKPIFVTGIGTGIGKTLIAAILVEKLKADYWKVIQSGDLDNSDTNNVRNLVSNNISQFHPEAYRFTQPFSPHKSAALDKNQIDFASITLPETERLLIIEGAGGLMVPLNNEHLMIDLISKFKASVILVVQNYLGSINHTLLSIEALKNRNIYIEGIVFNGDADDYSEDIILHKSGLKLLGKIPSISGDINKETVINLTDRLDV